MVTAKEKYIFGGFGILVMIGAFFASSLSEAKMIPQHSKSQTHKQANATLKQASARLAKMTQILAQKTKLESVQTNQRWSHAKELLGELYRASAVRVGENFANMDGVVLQFVTRKLKPKFVKESSRVTQAVLAESKKYRMDPIFLLAVIENESNFDPIAKGTSGEIGLMQIMPSTARWVSRQIGVRFKNPKQLRDPVFNIQLGAAYLSFLRERFDHQSKLYLAAYNMGSKKLHRSLARQVVPKKYSHQVLNHYMGFYKQLLALKSNSEIIGG